MQKRRTLIADIALFRDMAAETVEEMPLGFVALDQAGCATYANPMALTLTGASLDALVGRRPWDLFPEIVGTQHQTVRASAPITIEYEEHFAPSDRWAAVLAFPTTTGISILLRDVSGQKRAEETVRSSVALLHGSLDAMLDACMVCSAERDDQGAIVSFRIDFTNVVAGMYLGSPPEKLIGAPIPDWKINPRDMPFLDACRRVVETGDPLSVDALAYAIAGPEGTSTPGALSLQVARFSDGFFATWRDVTETQRLATERERIVAIVDQVTDGIVAVDAELRITYANAAFAGHAGRAPSELVGRHVLEVVDGTLDAPTLAKLAEVARSGQPWLGEVERRLADGTVGPVQIRATPRLAADGTLEGYVVVSRDVSELRRGEADLRASEEKYRTLFEESFDGLFVTSPAGRILDMNRKGVAMFGYDTKEEMLRLDLERDVYVRPADRARIFAMVRDGGSAEYEVDVKKKNGEQMTTQCSLTAVLDEHGAIASYRGIIRDITERKQATRERDRLAAATEQSPNGIFIADADGQIVYANPVYAAGSGYPAAELVGRSVVEAMAIGVDAATVADSVRAVSTGQAWSGEIDHRNPDGNVSHLEASINQLREANGEISGLLGITRDVTEREQARAALAASEATLRTAMDSMLDGVVVSSAIRDEAGRIVDFRIDSANATIGAISGVPADHQIGHTLLELFPAHRADGQFDAFVAVVETGVPFDSPDVHYVDPDAAGGPLDQYIDSYVAKLGDGYMTSIRDVTERHLAELEMRRLSAAIGQSEDGILILDSVLRITYANAAFAADLSRDPSELLGQGIVDVVGSVLDATTVAAIGEVARAGRPWLGELDRRLPDGSVGRLQVRFTPRLAATGTVKDIVINLRDVTELRRGEAERVRLSAAIEQSADAVVITDADARIEYVNPAFEKVSGYTRAEAIGQNPRILQSGVQDRALYAAMWAALTSGKSFVGDLTNRRKDGSLYQEQAVISPVVDAGGKTMSYVAVSHDVTRERALEAASVRLARERAQIAETLANLQVGPTPEATAEAICREVTMLAGVTTAALWRFSIEGPMMPLALVRVDGTAVPLLPLPVGRSEYLHERAAGGPWVEAWVRQPGHPYDRLFRAMGVRAASYAPVRHGGDVVGLLIITCSDEDAISRLTESLPALLEFAAVASALVGPAVVGLTEVGHVRQRISGIIGDGLFHPVFQPIVDLQTGEAMGYEALTRFDSGQRPDLCFADAWSVGLGPQLELATLEAAVAAARQLPAGMWLDLNASPRLLADPGRLREVLWSADRALVLEVTEHEVIEDYDAVRAAIRGLGHDIRVAVDDAGAGVANFGHIIDLRPDFVKLDFSLVRRVNANLGRQALVIGMRHFSRTAGCRLVAEGVETEEEAATLRALGVEFGQGYLFGHPGPVEMWAAVGDSQGRRGHATLPPDTPPKDVP